MSHMVVKKNLLIIYFFISTILSAGNQVIDIALNLTYPGASQHIIGDKMVIDLGFLKEGSYVGNGRIEIGRLTININQTMSSEDSSGCILENIELDGVDLSKLQTISERISTVDTIYVGNSSEIILSVGDVSNIVTVGSVDSANNYFYFVAPECLTEGLLEGEALTNLKYDLKLYAEITNVNKGSVVAAKAQDKNGVSLSIRDLIINQILGRTRILSKRRSK